MCFMREDEALQTLHLFVDGTEEKGISKRAIKNWVVSCIIFHYPHYVGTNYIVLLVNLSLII